MVDHAQRLERWAISMVSAVRSAGLKAKPCGRRLRRRP